MSFSIEEIVELSGVKNEVIVRVKVDLEFELDFLRWNSSMEEIRFRQSDLDVLIFPDVLSFDEDLVTMKIERETARLNRTGKLIWRRLVQLKICSTIDLTFYPFDRHLFQIDLKNQENIFKLDFRSNFSTNNETRLSRAFFTKILSIEATSNGENLDFITVKILVQRRREIFLSTIVLPIFFLSTFVFIFYFSSIETNQRLIMNFLHILATIVFIVDLDRKIELEKLEKTPIVVQYLSILFIVEILSLFFDHVIHSIFYGGIHFVSYWFQDKSQNDSTAVLARVTSLNNDFQNSNDFILKQIFERESNDNEQTSRRDQWKKQARFSECLCATFFFLVILFTFIFAFFFLPKLHFYRKLNWTFSSELTTNNKRDNYFNFE